MQDHKNNEVIEKCLSLEKELSKYKLWGNLIPKKSFIPKKTIWVFREY